MSEEPPRTRILDLRDVEKLDAYLAADAEDRAAAARRRAAEQNQAKGATVRQAPPRPQVRP